MKYQELKKSINKPYFKKLDFALRKLKIYDYQLSLWQKKGYIGRLKRGSYFFTDERDKIVSEEVSFFLYEPSYISLETMLNYYGIIPEIVYSQTAVTTRASRKFENAFGNFTYRHISPKLFFGYIPKETPAGKYLMAEPEKALLDYLYFNLGKIANPDDIAELRINSDELKKIIDRKKLNEYLAQFGIKKLEKITNLLFE